MIEHEPETSRVMKKQQWENHCERHPEGELLVDCQAREDVQEQISRNCDRHRRGIVDVHRADEVALLAFVL